MPSSACKFRGSPRSTLFPYTTLFRSGCRRGCRFSCNRTQPSGWDCPTRGTRPRRSEEHTSELQSLRHLVCRLLLASSGDHRDLHSFPTRRSSDLVVVGAVGFHVIVRSLLVGIAPLEVLAHGDRKSTRLNSSHLGISYAVFCLQVPGITEIYTLSLHDALPIWLS